MIEVLISVLFQASVVLETPLGWTPLHRDYAIAVEHEWLVERDPFNGDCEMVHWYIPRERTMIMSMSRVGIPSLVFQFANQGPSGDVTYQIDDHPPQVVPVDEETARFGFRFPEAGIPALREGRSLTIRVPLIGEAVYEQTFGLRGFAAASDWLDREICQFIFSDPAPDVDGQTALDVSLVRGPGGEIHVVGETNLPDGMRLSIMLRQNYLAYYEWESATVEDGRFRTAAYLDDGAPLPVVTFEVIVDSAASDVQPESVRSIIGENGEGLTGPATRNGRVRWIVERDAP